MAFFKSRVFATKMKSSGLTAKERFPTPPVLPSDFSLPQNLVSKAYGEEQTAENRAERREVDDLGELLFLCPKIYNSVVRKKFQGCLLFESVKYVMHITEFLDLYSALAP